MSAEDSHAVVDADIAARVAPNVLAWGAPYQVQSGFHVKGKRVQAAYDLGNLSSLLEGGYLGGSREGDRFALTLDAPFLYVNDAGHVTATFSEEEWRLRTALATEAAGAGEEGGAASYDEALTRAAEAAADPQQAKNAPRAAIFADAVPDGWSLWQEHGGDYVRVSDEQMAEGVSGRLVFVYEGNDGKLAADAALPAFDLGFAGEVPADAVATVHFGYEAHSFTAVAEGDAELVTVYGDAKRASVASYSLVNRSEPMGGSLTAEVYRAPSVTLAPDDAPASDATPAPDDAPASDATPAAPDGASAGYLMVLARYAMGSASARGWALDASFRADWNGKGGLTVEQLAAHIADEDGDAQENRDEAGVVRTDEEFLAETSFVGVPGRGGVIAVDVTGLNDEEIASIDPADQGSLDAFGLRCVPYTVSPDGSVRVASEGASGAIASDEARTVLLAVPYSEDSLAAAEEGDGYAPVEVRLDLQAAVVSHGESFIQAQFTTLASDVEVVKVEAPADDGQDGTAQAPSEGPSLPGVSEDGSLVPRDDNELSASNGEAPAADADDAAADDALDMERSQLWVSRMNETGKGPIVLGNALSRSADPLYNRPAPFSPRAGDGQETILVGGLPAGYVDPNLKVTPGGGTAMGNNTYMIKSTDSPFLDLTADVGYDAGFMGLPATGYADGEREDAAPVFELQIPYFIPSGSGSFTEEYNYNTWTSFGNQIGSDSSTRGPRLALKLNSDCFNGKWKIYDMDRSGSTKGTELDGDRYKSWYNSEGITGTFRLKYMGNASNKWQLIKDFARLSLGVTFIGSIPENTGGTIRWGVTYNSYTDANGNVLRGSIDTVVSPGAQSDSSTQRNATFIKTNLDWHTNVEALTKQQVLWDRYNYMVYRVTTRNVSPEEASQIDYLSYFFKFPSAELTNAGIRDADLVTWLVENPRTEKEVVTKNPDPRATASGKEYVGVPGQGGALIYDITNNPGVVNQLDLQSFENAEELGLHELPYTTAGMNGQISFMVPEVAQTEIIKPDAGPDDKPYNKFMGGSMYYGPLKKSDDQKTDRKVFLLALPYTTNMRADEYVTLDTESTVHFGGRGIDNYMWTKTYSTTAQFAKPTAGAKIEKTALNIKNEGEGETQEAPLGHSVTYRLKNLSITGNQPLFGTSLDDDFGAQILDTLPTGLNLQQVSIKVDKSVASREDSYDPNTGKQPLKLTAGEFLNGINVVPSEDYMVGASREVKAGDVIGGVTVKDGSVPAPGDTVTLVEGDIIDGYTVVDSENFVEPVTVPDAADISDWFAADRGSHGTSGVLEFEYRDRLGKLQWKVIDNLPVARSYTTSGTGSIEYTFGNAADPAKNLSTILETNGIGAIPHASGGVVTGTNGTFTGRVRFLLKKRVPQYRGLSVIPVTLEITGALITPRSNGVGGLYTNKANVSFGQKQWVTSSSEGGQYYTLIEQSSTPDPASFKATPTKPLISGGAFSGNNGGVGSVADLKETLVNEPNAGWRFHIGNDSLAPMEPAYLLVGDKQTPAGAVAGATYPGMFYEGVRGVRRGFEAEKVTIGGNMFEAGAIEGVEINYYSKNANDTLLRTTTLTAAQLEAYRTNDTDGDGLVDAVLPSALWADQYFMNVKVNFSSYKPGDGNNNRGTIEIIGTPNQVLTMPLVAKWTTNYDDTSYNQTVSKTATLKSAYVPIKPALAVNAGWGGNGLAAQANVSVPYRWGDGEGEEAYFSYTFTNDSFFTARRLNLDLQINDNAASSMVITTDEDGSPLQRGFVGEELVLPGFEWNTYTTSVEREMPERLGTTPDGKTVTLNKRDGEGNIAFNIDIDGDGVADFLIDANNDGVVDDPDDVYQYSPIYDEVQHTGWLHKNAAISAIDFFSANINGELAKTNAAQAAAEEAARQMSYDAVGLQNFIYLDTQDGSGKGDGPRVAADAVSAQSEKTDTLVSTTSSGANTVEVWEHVTTETYTYTGASLTQGDFSLNPGDVLGVRTTTVRETKTFRPDGTTDASEETKVTYSGRTATLRVPLGKKFDFSSDPAAEMAIDPDDTIVAARVHFDRLDGKSTYNGGTITPAWPTFNVYGRADTLATTTARANVYATTEEYGSDLRAKASRDMGVFTATSAMNAKSFKPAAARKVTAANNGPDETQFGNGAGDADANELANYTDAVGYRFWVNSTSYARMDNASITVSVRSLSDKLPAPIDDIQGFLTKKVVLSRALLDIGSDYRSGTKAPAKDETALKKVAFYFRNADALNLPLYDDQLSNPPIVVELSTAEVLQLFADADAGSAVESVAIDFATAPQFAAAQGRYLEKIVASYSEIDPQIGDQKLADSEDKQLFVELEGQANWWYSRLSKPNFNHLPAQMVIAQQNRTIGGTPQLSAGKSANRDLYSYLTVNPPALSVHTYGQYGNNADQYMNQNSPNDGGDVTAVPYDRDFKMWVNLFNEGAISTLDDVDVDVNIPMKWESSVQLDGSTESGWVGFHTTQVRFRHAWFDTFYRGGTIGKIRFSGYDESDSKKVKTWTISPDAGYQGGSEAATVANPLTAFVDEHNGGAAETYYVATIDGVEYPLTKVDDTTYTYEKNGVTETLSDLSLVEEKTRPAGSDMDDTAQRLHDGLKLDASGDLVIGEEVLRAHGIYNLIKVELISWKDMQEQDSKEGRSNQNIEFTGFHDVNLGEKYPHFRAEARNYLLGIRPANGDEPGTVDDATWKTIAAKMYTPVTRGDSSQVYSSKMYFDTVSRAGLYDGNKSYSGIDDALIGDQHSANPTKTLMAAGDGNALSNRFTKYTAGSWDGHHWGHSDGSGGESNAMLEVGYKSQISLLSDFRQVNSQYNVRYPEFSGCTYNGGILNEQKDHSYVGPETYNTGVTLHVTQQLPSTVFDAYYVKIRSVAMLYMQGIDVLYKDGSVMSLSEDDLRKAYDATDTIDSPAASLECETSTYKERNNAGKGNESQNDATATDDSLKNNRYFRLNLLKTDGAGKPVASLGAPTNGYNSDSANGTGVTEADAYKDPVSGYELKDGTTVQNPVVSITYHLKVNQNQYQGAQKNAYTGQNAGTDTAFDANAVAADAKLNTPDYGTWYALSETTAGEWVKKMAFEVNGRVYRTVQNMSTAQGTGQPLDFISNLSDNFNTMRSAEMDTITESEIGGDYSGNQRPGHKALKRANSPYMKSGNTDQSVYGVNGALNTADSLSRITFIAPGKPSRRNAPAGRTYYPNGAGSLAQGDLNVDFRSAWAYQDWHSEHCCYWCGHNHGRSHMRHMVSRTFFTSTDDGVYTRKGVDAGLVLGNDHNDNATFGGNHNFNVSLYRTNIRKYYYTGADYRYGDDWYDRYLSHADSVVLTDTLPEAFKEEQLNYYGYLAKGLSFQVPNTSGTAYSLPADNDSLYAHLKNYEGASVTLYTRKTPKWPNGGTKEWFRKIVIDHEAITVYEKDASGKWVENAAATARFEERTETVDGDTVTVPKKNLTYLLDKGKGQGDLWFRTYRDATDAQAAAVSVGADEDELDNVSARTEIPGYSATNSEGMAQRFAGKVEQSVYLDFAANEYLDYYEIDCGPYYGSGDITSEYVGHYAEKDKTVDTKDFQLLGSPYVYKRQQNPLTGKVTDVRDATNRMEVFFSHDYAPLSAATVGTGTDTDANHGTGRLRSPGWRGGWSDTGDVVNGGSHRWYDEAYYLGFLIPYGYKYSLQAVTTDSNANTDPTNGKPSEDSSYLYDYYLDGDDATPEAANNLLPNTAKFLRLLPEHLRWRQRDEQGVSHQPRKVGEHAGSGLPPADYLRAAAVRGSGHQQEPL